MIKFLKHGTENITFTPFSLNKNSKFADLKFGDLLLKAKFSGGTKVIYIGMDTKKKIWYFDMYEERILTIDQFLISHIESTVENISCDPDVLINGPMNVEELLNTHLYPYSDIEIVVNDTFTELKFKLHKAILATQCEFFHQSFKKFNENTVEGEELRTIHIKMTKTGAVDFHMFTRYLYGIKVILNRSNFFNMLNLAKTFICKDLQKDCFHFFEEHMCFEWLKSVLDELVSFPELKLKLFQWFDKVWILLIQTNLYEDYCQEKDYENVFLDYVKKKNEK